MKRGGRRPNAGRKPNPLTETYQLRGMPEDFELWLAAAGVPERGPVFLHWIRTTLTKEANRARKRT